tara:strand:+ start:916 stop:1578 length:663 start_codon:yes stop_codon:yes gene_type:complete
MPHTPDHKGLLKTDRLSASERSRLRTLRRKKKSGSLSGSQLAELKGLRKQRRKAIGKDLLKAGALVGGAALAAPALAGGAAAAAGGTGAAGAGGAGAGKLLGLGKLGKLGKAIEGADKLGKIGKAVEGADKLGKLKKAVDVVGDVKEVAEGVKEVTGALGDVKDLVAPKPLMEDMIGEPQPIQPTQLPQIDNTVQGGGLAGLANTFKYGGRVRKKKKKKI